MSRKTLFLVAGGGHGRVVLDSLLRAGTVVDGIIDGGMPVGERVFGIPVVGNDDFLETLDPRGAALLNGFGAVTNVERRRLQYENWVSKGFNIHGAMHPDIVLGSECEIDPSTQILAGAVLQNRVQIGSNAVINTAARVDHDCRIGAHCYVSPAAVLCGGVVLDNSVFVGAGAVLVPGVRVGANTVIGAGSIVLQNVAPGVTVVGNPARVIGGKH